MNSKIMQENLQNNVAFYNGNYVPVNQQTIAAMISRYSAMQQMPDHRNPVNCSSFNCNNNPTSLCDKGIIPYEPHLYDMLPSQNEVAVSNHNVFQERMFAGLQYTQDDAKYQANNNYAGDNNQVYDPRRAASVNVMHTAVMNAQQHAISSYFYMPTVLSMQSLDPSQHSKAEFENAMLMKEQDNCLQNAFRTSTRFQQTNQSVVPVIVDVRSLAPDPQTTAPLCITSSENFVKPVSLSYVGPRNDSEHILKSILPQGCATELHKGIGERQPGVVESMPKVESVWSIGPDNTSVPFGQVKDAYNSNELISGCPVVHQNSTVQHIKSHPTYISGTDLPTNLNPVVSCKTSSFCGIPDNSKIKQCYGEDPDWYSGFGSRTVKNYSDILHANNLPVKNTWWEQVQRSADENRGKYPNNQTSGNVSHREPVQKSADELHVIYPSNQTSGKVPHSELVQKSADEHHAIYPNNQTSGNIPCSGPVQKFADEHCVKYPNNQNSGDVPCSRPVQKSVDEHCTKYPNNQTMKKTDSHTHTAMTSTTPISLKECNANTVVRCDKMQKPLDAQLANNWKTDDFKYKPMQSLSDASYVNNVDTKIDRCDPVMNLLDMPPGIDRHINNFKCNQPKNSSHLSNANALIHKNLKMNFSDVSHRDGRPMQCELISSCPVAHQNGSVQHMKSHPNYISGIDLSTNLNPLVSSKTSSDICGVPGNSKIKQCYGEDPDCSSRFGRTVKNSDLLHATNLPVKNTSREQVQRSADENCGIYPNNQTSGNVPHSELVQKSADEHHVIYANNQTSGSVSHREPVQKSADEHCPKYPNNQMSGNVPHSELVQKSADEHHAMYPNNQNSGDVPCSRPVQKSVDEHCTKYPNNQTMKKTDTHTHTAMTSTTPISLKEHNANTVVRCDKMQKPLDAQLANNWKTDDFKYKPMQSLSDASYVNNLDTQIGRCDPVINLLDMPPGTDKHTNNFKCNQPKNSSHLSKANDLIHKNLKMNLSDASHEDGRPIQRSSSDLIHTNVSSGDAKAKLSVGDCSPMKNLSDLSQVTDLHTTDLHTKVHMSKANDSACHILYKKKIERHVTTQSTNSNPSVRNDESSKMMADLSKPQNDVDSCAKEHTRLETSCSSFLSTTHISDHDKKIAEMEKEALSLDDGQMKLHSTANPQNNKTMGDCSLNQMFKKSKLKIKTFSGEEKQSADYSIMNIMTCNKKKSSRQILFYKKGESVTKLMNNMLVTNMSADIRELVKIKGVQSYGKELFAPNLKVMAEMLPSDFDYQVNLSANKIRKKGEQSSRTDLVAPNLKVIVEKLPECQVHLSTNDRLKKKGKRTRDEQEIGFHPKDTISKKKKYEKNVDSINATLPGASVPGVHKRYSGETKMCNADMKVPVNKYTVKKWHHSSGSGFIRNKDHQQKTDMNSKLQKKSRLKEVHENRHHQKKCKSAGVHGYQLYNKNVPKADVHGKKKNKDEIHKTGVQDKKCHQKQMQYFPTNLPHAATNCSEQSVTMQTLHQKCITSNTWVAKACTHKNNNDREQNLDVANSDPKISKCVHYSKHLIRKYNSEERQRRESTSVMHQHAEMSQGVKGAPESSKMETSGKETPTVPKDSSCVKVQMPGRSTVDIPVQTKSTSGIRQQTEMFQDVKGALECSKKGTSGKETSTMPKESFCVKVQTPGRRSTADIPVQMESTSIIRQQAEMLQDIKHALESSKKETSGKETPTMPKESSCVMKVKTPGRRSTVDVPVQMLVKYLFNGIRIPCITRYNNAFLPLNLIHKQFFVTEPLIKFRRVLHELHMNKREMSVTEQQMLEPILKKYNIKSSKLIMFSELVQNFDKMCSKMKVKDCI